MTDLIVQPVSVETDSADEEGRLVAVLVRLDDIVHEEDCGRWWLEAGFGRCMALRPRPFASLDEGLSWIVAQLEACTAQTLKA